MPPEPPPFPRTADWITYADAPSAVADRAHYEQLLASCREDWERTRDPQALVTAQSWAFMHRQWPPNWLLEAIGAVLCRRRGKEHAQHYQLDVQNRLRWMTVRRFHDDGATWERACEQAEAELKETAARGSAETMWKSYKKFKRKLEVSPAQRALF